MLKSVLLLHSSSESIPATPIGLADMFHQLPTLMPSSTKSGCNMERPSLSSSSVLPGRATDGQVISRYQVVAATLKMQTTKQLLSEKPQKKWAYI